MSRETGEMQDLYAAMREVNVRAMHELQTVELMGERGKLGRALRRLLRGRRLSERDTGRVVRLACWGMAELWLRDVADGEETLAALRSRAREWKRGEE